MPAAGRLALAIELAAARVRLVGVEALRDSLESGLEMLRTTAPDVPERQRALATTIAWSHDRLGDGARQLCRRLVVFEQAFTLEAVEAVAADVGDVIELLTQVMEAGLIRPLIGRIRIGFVMPRTVRTFVRRLVSDARENDPACLALADYLLDHVTRWQGTSTELAGRWPWPGSRTSGSTCTRPSRPPCASGGSRKGWPSPWPRGPSGSPPASRAGLARARTVRMWLATRRRPVGCTSWRHGWPTTSTRRTTRWPTSRGPWRSRSRAVTRRRWRPARCSPGVLLVSGEVERGSGAGPVGCRAAARLAAYPLVAEALSARAIGHAVAGEFEDERATHVARLVVAREHGDVARTADALVVLAEIALDEADGATARAYAEEALAIAQPGLPVEAREALIALSRAQLTEGDPTGATVTLGQAYEAAEKIGQKLALAQCYRVAGCLAAARGMRGQPSGCSLPRSASNPRPAARTNPSRATSPEDWTPLVRPWGRRRSRVSGPWGRPCRTPGCESCCARWWPPYRSEASPLGSNTVVTEARNAYSLARGNAELGTKMRTAYRTMLRTVLVALVATGIAVVATPPSGDGAARRVHAHLGRRRR